MSKISQLYELGHGIKSIMLMVGLGQKAVVKDLKENNVVMRRIGRQTMPNRNKETAAVLCSVESPKASTYGLRILEKRREGLTGDNLARMNRTIHALKTRTVFNTVI